jgi:hypothetical protein
MRSHTRLWFVYLILAVLLALVPAAAAQDDGLLGLTGEDLALFAAGNEASAMADSLAFTFSVTLRSTEANADLSGTGVFGQDASGMPMGILTLTGTGELTEEGQTELTTVNVEVRIVDGMIYINDLTSDTGWMGASLDEVFSGALAESGLPVDPADLMSGDPGDVMGGADMGALMGALDDLMSSGFITIRRVGDAVVNGTSTAQFNINVSLATLVQSDAFGSIMMASGQLEGTPEEMQQQLQFLQPLLMSLVQGISINFDQYIAVDAPNQVQRGVLAVDLMIPSLTGEAEATVIGLNVTIDITDYAPDVSVTAPESFTLMEDIGM